MELLVNRLYRLRRLGTVSARVPAGQNPVDLERLTGDHDPIDQRQEELSLPLRSQPVVLVAFRDQNSVEMSVRSRTQTSSDLSAEAHP